MTLTIPEIERLLADATPGPWEIDPHSDMPDCMNDVWFSDEIRVCTDVDGSDARLIAAAPDLARLAIDQARELEETKAERDRQYDENVSLIARIAELEGFIEWAYDTLWEINPGNYHHDDVCKLNDASVEVLLAIKSRAALKEQPE